MKIYIPTLSRIGDQVTLDHMPPKYQTRVIMVVQEKQFKPYQSLYKHKVKDFLVLDNDIGIAKTRELICRDAGKTRFSMIDDDVKFMRRNTYKHKDHGYKNNMEKTSRLMTESDWDDMYYLMNQWMDAGFIHCGHRRKFAPMTRSYSENVFFNDIHHLNGDLLSKIFDKINFTRVEFGEDANLMFEYLTRGFKNKRSDEFVYWGDSYKQGGCDDYRDGKYHDSEHKKLQDYWGDDVVILKKRMMAQSKYGKERMGMINEYGYKPKLAYKKSQK